MKEEEATLNASSREGAGARGEMAQTMYAHMNK
jgi:hypothetical protein